ncbi:MAG: sigma-54-dependent transcriptional regulator [Chloroflexota bacterium]
MSASAAPRTLVVIDDDRVFCEAISHFFTAKSLDVLIAHTGAEGLSACRSKRADVVLLDQHLPDTDGHSLCEPIMSQNDQTKIIFITAHPSFDNVIIAMRCGAYDYLSKPFELEELSLAIDRALRTISLENAEHIQRYRVSKESEKAVIVGSDQGLSEVARLADVAATSDSPVLITGETGTGKNLVAATIHYRGFGAGAPFITINCAALPENLIEAELFGYDRGAFTGAVSTKKGIFEMADGGTLFLDEIGELPLHLQAKLLSAIEDKKIRRLGSESARPVNVRIIASTSVAIEQALGSTFRSDLYFRLSVVRIHMPPLRERRQDIPQLCAHLLKELTGGTSIQVPDDELSKLMQYSWPGNVRELRNVLERAVILQEDAVFRPSELLASSSTVPTPSSTHAYTHCTPSAEVMTLADIEKDYIRFALQRLSNNYSRTARALGISLSTLKRKLTDYSLK